MNELDLKLKVVDDVSSVEIDSITVKSVNVANKSEGQIKFDIISEGLLYVRDKMSRYTDVSEEVYQWFVVSCTGSLSQKLEDINVEFVDVYTSKNKEVMPLSDSLVPIIKKEQFDAIATDILKQYYPEVLETPMWVNPYELAKNMNLMVLEEHISEDSTVFGQIYFKDTIAKLFDIDTNSEKIIEVKAGTVIVDPSVSFQRNLGSLHNTIVHECVHWALHRKAVYLESLFNDDISSIRCKIDGSVANQDSTAINWMEWQVNTLAPKIQMPIEMFKKQVELTIAKYRREKQLLDPIEWIQPVIDDVAQFFMVSRLAAKIRMIDAGYEVATGAFVYLNNQYVPPYRTTNKMNIARNHTFSIDMYDLGILLKTSPELKEKMVSNRYTYVESHVVLNLPLYVEKNLMGEEVLTEYARKNMDECCLAFEMTVRSNYNKYYDSICVLNRDKIPQ